MSSLLQITRIFSTWPGDLVYHLVVLFAIEAIVGLAMSFRAAFARGQADDRERGNPWPRSMRSLGRVFQAALALTFGRIVLILAAAIAQGTGLSTAVILPPLERFVDVAGLGLLAWAFVPLWAKSRWASYVLSLATPAVAFVMYVFLALGWYSTSQGAPFNGSPQDIFWSVWGLALAGVAAAGVLLGLRQVDGKRADEHPNTAGYTLSAFVFIFAGCLLHLLFPERDLSAAGWTRLAFFVAFPLLVVAFYQQGIQQIVAVNAGGMPSPGLGADEREPAWPVWGALRLVAESADRASRVGALQKVSSAIATAMKVPVAAIGIPGVSPDVVELVAVCCPGKVEAAGGLFHLDTQPAIKFAITRKQGLPLDPQSNEAATLAGLVGSSPLASLWVEPLVHSRQALGMLVVGKEKNAPAWSAAEGQEIHACAVYLANALNAARNLEAAMQRNQELARQIASLESQLSQSKAGAETLLNTTRAELQQSQAELHAARQQIAQYRKQIEDLAALVQLQDRIVQDTQHQDDQ